MSRADAPHLVFRLQGVVMQTAAGTSSMTPGMEELLRELFPDLSMWLFCEPAGEDIAPAAESLCLERMIPRARWLFASGGFTADQPGELVEELMRRTGAKREQLLWIDDRPAVTAAVLRAGMNAVIFVDAFRLRRNLALRGLVQ